MCLFVCVSVWKECFFLSIESTRIKPMVVLPSRVSQLLFPTYYQTQIKHLSNIPWNQVQGIQHGLQLTPQFPSQVCESSSSSDPSPYSRLLVNSLSPVDIVCFSSKARPKHQICAFSLPIPETHFPSRDVPFDNFPLWLSLPLATMNTLDL